MSEHGTQLEEILERYPARPEYLIFFLQDIQSNYGYISPDSMCQVCERTGVPLTQGYSVATFYQSFRLEPSGEHEIRVCLGTACHLKGGQRIVDELQRKLHVEPGGTTADLCYTLNTVNCVGACALAPVVVIDEEYQPNATAQKLEKILRKMDQEGVENREETENA